MQGQAPRNDLKIMNFDPLDMILGVDKLRQYSPMLLDVKNYKLSFVKDGRTVELLDTPHRQGVVL